MIRSLVLWVSSLVLPMSVSVMHRFRGSSTLMLLTPNPLKTLCLECLVVRQRSYTLLRNSPGRSKRRNGVDIVVLQIKR